MKSVGGVTSGCRGNGDADLNVLRFFQLGGMAAWNINNLLPKIVVIRSVGEYIAKGGRRRRRVVGKFVAGGTRKRLATLLFGLLDCLFGDVTSGVIRLVAMSFLAVADTCCRVAEAFTTLRARVSKFVGARESHELETKKTVLTRRTAWR